MKRMISFALTMVMILAMVPSMAIAAAVQSTPAPHEYISNITETENTSVDLNDVTARFEEDGMTREVAVSLGNLKDDATEQMREDFEKDLEEMDEAEKKLTVRNLNLAIEQSKDIKLPEKMDKENVLATKPTPIVAAEYPVTVSILVKEEDQFLFPAVFVDSEWKIPEEFSYVKEADGTVRAEFKIETSSLISFVGLPSEQGEFVPSAEQGLLG